MPSHSHNVVWGSEDGSGVTISNSGSGARVLNIESWAWRNNGSGKGNNVYGGLQGGGQAHENMSPYVTTYIWKRIN